MMKRAYHKLDVNGSVVIEKYINRLKTAMSSSAKKGGSE